MAQAPFAGLGIHPEGVRAKLMATKSEIIDGLAISQRHLAHHDVELGVKEILEHIGSALALGQRIEIRGFGSFSLHFRPPRQGRNPKTGQSVALPGKNVPYFKPGKELRDRVNAMFSEIRQDPRVASDDDDD